MHMKTASLKIQNNSLSTFEFRVIFENVILDMKCHDKFCLRAYHTGTDMNCHDKFGQEPYPTQRGRSKIHSRHNLCT